MLFLFGGDFGDVGIAAVPVLREQVVADFSHQRGIADTDDWLLVVRGDLDRGVCFTGGGATNEERLLEAALLHLCGVENHLVERGRDQAGEPNDVGTPCFGFLEDGVAVDHDPEVLDFVVVTREHDGDDVLADVVHVAFDRCDQELAGR